MQEWQIKRITKNRWHDSLVRLSQLKTFFVVVKADYLRSSIAKETSEDFIFIETIEKYVM